MSMFIVQAPEHKTYGKIRGHICLREIFLSQKTCFTYLIEVDDIVARQADSYFMKKKNVSLSQEEYAHRHIVKKKGMNYCWAVTYVQPVKAQFSLSCFTTSGISRRNSALCFSDEEKFPNKNLYF